MPGVSRRRLLAGVGLAGGGFAAVGLLAFYDAIGSTRDKPRYGDERIRWKTAYVTDFDGYSRPMTVLADAGQLYATHDGKLYRLDPASGAQLWESPHGTWTQYGDLRAPILVGGLLILIKDNSDKVLKAVDAATGALRWEFGASTGFPHPWPAVGEGKICFSTSGGFTVLDPATGKARWSHAHLVGDAAFPFGAPVIDRGAIYITDEGGDLGSFQLDQDAVRWAVPRSQDKVSRATVSVDGDLVIATGLAGIYAYDAAAGNLRWSVRAGQSFDRTSSISGDVVVAWDSLHGKGVYAFDRTGGAPRWTYTPGGKLGGHPVVHDDAVYVPAEGFLHAVDLATGRTRWTVTAKGETFNTPGVGDGTVYSFTTGNRDVHDYLYAIAI